MCEHTDTSRGEKFTIAVLSDIHQGDPPRIAARRGEFGATLLHRAVARFNRFIKPDLVLILGDLLDDPHSERAEADLAEIRAILDKLECPAVVIPGNHDPSPERFYQVMDRPGEVVDVGRVRVLPFVDPEEPGYHAHRIAGDLERLRGARTDGFEGFVIAMQHVPVRPRGSELAHTYTNLDEVLEAAHAGQVDLCVAGHSHQSCEPVREGRCRFFAVGALCEHPHPYALLTLEGQDTLHVRNENLAMPREWNLVDYHSHTQFAYCAQTVHTQRSPAFAETMGLGGMAFTEHSGHLYVTRHDYWSGRFCEWDVAQSDPGEWRMDDYMRTLEKLRSPRVMVGMEVDADFQGRQFLLDEHRGGLELIVGAVHYLPESVKPAEQRDPQRFTEQFQRITERLCLSGIDILAHPFRIYRRSQLPVPTHLYQWLANLLAQQAIVSEMNYHTNEPHREFVQLCLEMGVKLSFGSDAHELWEVGEFYPHIKMLQSLGVNGDPGGVLADFIVTAKNR